MRETSEEDTVLIEKEKKIIFAAQPHGVVSVTGICSAINMVGSIGIRFGERAPVAQRSRRIPMFCARLASLLELLSTLR